MWVNLRLWLEPRREQSQELVELLKQVAATQIQRRNGWIPNPVDWLIALIEPPIDRFSRAYLNKIKKVGHQSRAGETKHKGELP